MALHSLTKKQAAAVTQWARTTQELNVNFSIRDPAEMEKPLHLNSHRIINKCFQQEETADSLQPACSQKSPEGICFEPGGCRGWTEVLMLGRRLKIWLLRCGVEQRDDSTSLRTEAGRVSLCLTLCCTSLSTHIPERIERECHRWNPLKGNALTLRFPPSPHENGPDPADWWGALLQIFHVMTMAKEEAASWEQSVMFPEKNPGVEREGTECFSMKPWEIPAQTTLSEWPPPSSWGAEEIEPREWSHRPWSHRESLGLTSEWCQLACVTVVERDTKVDTRYKAGRRDGDRAVVVRRVRLLCNWLMRA